MIIDRYMVREVGLPFLAIASVLVIIFSTYSLTRYLVQANSGLLVAGEVLQLTFLRSMVSLEVLLPLSFYFAIMIGMGRLYSDSEIYAMRSSGISEHRLMRPVLVLALALALVTGFFSVVVRPWAYASSYSILAEAAATSEIDRIQPARFYHFKDSDHTVFIEHISRKDGSINGVFIRSRKGRDLQLITSTNGKLEYEARPDFIRLTLFDAQLFKKVADAPDLFAQLGAFSMWLPAGEAKPVGYKTKASPTRELVHAVSGPDRAELQWRLSTPGSALLLALLAIPLSRGRPRQGRYARVFLALAFYAIYFNLLDVNRTWVEQGKAETIWWVPGLTVLLVAALYAPWRKWLNTKRNGRRPAHPAGGKL
jgi:lipopolysaccharide export system permease protein